jgi:cell division protein FtsI/penicillin-binding protein 2
MGKMKKVTGVYLTGMDNIKSIKQKTSHLKSPENSWRMYGLVFFVFFAAILIVGKLYFIQIARHAVYAALAENQYASKTEVQAKRGEIFLQDENSPYPVAVNRELQMAYAVPREMKNNEQSIDTLSSILDLDRNTLADKLSDPNDMFEVLKHKLSDEETQKIKDAKLAGIYLSPESFRYYPAGELAAQVVGFVGSNGQQQGGMYGLEAYWDKQLRGEPGSLAQESDSQGRWMPISDRSVEDTQNGPDIILTINHTVQFEVEKILKEAVDGFKADSGTVVVMEAKTGKILAMASQPSFDPNNFASTEDISAFNNPAVSQPYEPGSVFKAFTEAIGVDEGKITPDSTYTDTGVVREAGYAIRNASTDPFNGYGVQTMTQVLERSLNTGVIYIEKLIGNTVFANYVKMFGFGQKTGIDLPGELAASTLNLNNPKTNINFFTAAFGQGITVTPLQLAAAYGAIANGGTLMKPYVVDTLKYSDGHEETTKPQEVRQVVSQDTAQKISQMLRDVVTNGNGKRADVPGYLVCGKTGTAQVASADAKGYDQGMTIGSFTGFAPMNDPQFVVVVKIVNPKTVQWAESSAAPATGQIMKFLLEYYKVQPTEDPKTSPLTKLAPLVWPPGQAALQPAPIVQPVPKTDDKKKSDTKDKDDAKVITSGD